MSVLKEMPVLSGAGEPEQEAAWIVGLYFPQYPQHLGSSEDDVANALRELVSSADGLGEDSWKEVRGPGVRSLRSLPDNEELVLSAPTTTRDIANWRGWIRDLGKTTGGYRGFKISTSNSNSMHCTPTCQALTSLICEKCAESKPACDSGRTTEGEEILWRQTQQFCTVLTIPPLASEIDQPCTAPGVRIGCKLFSFRGNENVEWTCFVFTACQLSFSSKRTVTRGSSEDKDTCEPAVSFGEEFWTSLSLSANKFELLGPSDVSWVRPGDLITSPLKECREPDVLELEDEEIGPRWTRPSFERSNGIGAALRTEEVVVDAKAS
ncbi:uncharacterized protein BT62DRAFT_922252 [Guyanagaster necrorhizus]|uniref:Uncharacterized protein n=1 Tax=Guyanagaster necrorhizus TaxID=856835 RepID=A0A9P8APB5_9AGAR|nr:uncharacterized protein BT62DRAFT_922252 [Guyanagaster necrorhizus MCA 3950]KAG7443163.1 hypothetical protein BT62DRAFT_922252 [Guyanagaster necrorhizus MCA 3950]